MIALCLALLGAVCAPDSYVETAADIAARVQRLDALDVDLVPTPSSHVPTLPAPIAGDGARSATCRASWYGERHRGLPTASGEPFDPDGLTAARWDVPFGTRIEVIHGDRSVTVTINDRGPARRLGRCIDLSAAAFARLAPLGAGLIDVDLREVGQ